MADQLANHGGLTKAPAPQSAPGVSDTRGDLLSQIQQGVKLKKAGASEGRPVPAKAPADEGLTSLLASALTDFRKGNMVSSSEDEDGDDDADDWTDSD